ncbi:hypothetical protein [Amycolatopsis sp. DSM 110486]|uniref:hypothetical protein n=1 Tax=Amycolatopsis sp. DSM 110486 TaxID=2865832 RepID=UPI001C699DFB|nr:hypothetical protein [Amycolatopsis sp. DSM 110486]QYN17528.1 hypothetical protein K1T34_32605 [Amycolatopsis sp. DSM 110486]
MLNPTSTKDLPADVHRAVATFLDAQPSVRIWQAFPDVTEAEYDQLDSWECLHVAEEFARHLAAAGVWRVELVKAEHSEHPLAGFHAWTRAVTDNATHINIDWTARQFYNLETPTAPRHLDIPAPLLWETGYQFGRHVHPVAGRFGEVTTHAAVPCAYCRTLIVEPKIRRRVWRWQGKGIVSTCTSCAHTQAA